VKRVRQSSSCSGPWVPAHSANGIAPHFVANRPSQVRSTSWWKACRRAVDRFVRPTTAARLGKLKAEAA
jgi:hypothetical protein